MRQLRRPVNRAAEALGLRSLRDRLRHRGLAPSDAFLASYPRSGSTWLRFMLFHLLSGEPSDFSVVYRGIPYVGRHRQAPALLPGGGRLIKTHEPYRRAYRKAVYAVRDVRDVVLSEFRYRRMLGYCAGELSGFLDDFLAGRLHGLRSWVEHVGSWLDSDLEPSASLLVVRFEDVQRNPERALADIASFLGAAPDADRLREAVSDNRLERMRDKEDRAGLRKSDPQLRHVGRGAVEGWREQLAPVELAAIEERTGPLLARLGYAPSTREG